MLDEFEDVCDLVEQEFIRAVQDNKYVAGVLHVPSELIGFYGGIVLVLAEAWEVQKSYLKSFNEFHLSLYGIGGVV